MNVMMLLEMASSAFPSARHLPTAALVPVSPTSSYLTPRGKADSIRNSGAERLVKLDVSNLGTPLSLFASAWAGVPYVPLNYRLTDGEIQALLARVTPAYLVTEDSRLSALGAVADVQAVSTGSF